MPLTHESIRLFWKLFVSSSKESSYEKSKISPFLNWVPVIFLMKFKLQIHPANPTNAGVYHEGLVNKVLIEIQYLPFIH